MKWRTFVWILRIAAALAVAYGLWCAVAFFAGKHYFRQGMADLSRNPSSAMRSFEIASKLQPGNARYRAAMGRAALKAQRYPDAAEHLRKAAELKPGDFGIWHDLGEAYLKGNAPAEAAKAYQRALLIRPEAELALEGLADAATRAGDSQTALEPLRQLWKRAPGDVDLAVRLAPALVKAGKYDEALQVCAKARQRAPKVEPGVLWSGQQPKGDWPQWCPLLVAEGDVYRAKGRFADAILAYQRCLTVEHGHTAALDGLAALPRDVCRRLASDQPVRGPRLSPNGQQVAFYGQGLQVVSLDDGSVTNCAPAAKRIDDCRPAWSPDGERLCYNLEGELHVVGVDGSGDRALVKARRLLPAGSALAGSGTLQLDVNPVWSPNGKKIAFYSRTDHFEGRTLVADLATGEARSEHRSSGKPPKFGAVHPPAWSPDGRILCAPLYYPGSARPGVTLCSGEGAVKRQLGAPTDGVALAPVERAVREVRWSPDMKHLAIVLESDQPARRHLAIVPLTGKPGHIVAKDVVAHRWLDARHVWLLQAVGDSYLTARLHALTCDLQGNLKPAKEPFPILLPGEWDLTRDGSTAAISGPAFAQPETPDEGLWVSDLRKLRGS
ncbi:MAG: tetratricopeptide repeat protein [Armatimonadetes bacterium]|nr:tetratricopeptide repeat protein [Armatimonadota bacterium]